MEISEDRVEYENSDKIDRFSIYLLITWILSMGPYFIGVPVQARLIISLSFTVVILVFVYRVKFSKKNPVTKVLFEYRSGYVYFCFYENSEPEEFTIEKAKQVIVGKDFIAFKGDYPFAKEVFFPKKYVSKISEIVLLIKNDYPEIEIRENA